MGESTLKAVSELVLLYMYLYFICSRQNICIFRNTNTITESKKGPWKLIIMSHFILVQILSFVILCYKIDLILFSVIVIRNVSVCVCVEVWMNCAVFLYFVQKYNKCIKKKKERKKEKSLVSLMSKFLCLNFKSICWCHLSLLYVHNCLFQWQFRVMR